MCIQNLIDKYGLKHKGKYLTSNSEIFMHSIFRATITQIDHDIFLEIR